MTGISEKATNASRLVLAKCAANDPWFPQPSEPLILAWAEQFGIANLAVEDLLAGVTAVYAHHGSGFRPLPADIIGAARGIVRDRFERSALADRAPREQLIDAKVAEHVAEIADALAMPDDDRPLKYQRPRYNPRLVDCEFCRARVGSPCVDPATKQSVRHYHPSRADAAKQLVDAGQVTR